LEKFEIVPDQSIFFDLTPNEASLLFYLFALSVEHSLTIDELNILANGLFLTAQVLFTIASQRTLLNDVIEAQQEKEATAKVKKENNTPEKLDPEIKKLQDQIEHLQKQLDALNKKK